MELHTGDNLSLANAMSFSRWSLVLSFIMGQVFSSGLGYALNIFMQLCKWLCVYTWMPFTPVTSIIPTKLPTKR